MLTYQEVDPYRATPPGFIPVVALRIAALPRMSPALSTSQTPVACRRCGRLLTDPGSIGQGIGPVCAAKEHGTVGHLPLIEEAA